jgi:hypothetical protein
MAGMGHCREGAPSNSNLSDRSLFEFRAGKRGARGALDGVVGIVVLIFSSCNIAIIRPMPVRRWGLNQVGKRRPGRGINGDQRRGAYIFTASIVVLIVVAFLVKWWLA